MRSGQGEKGFRVLAATRWHYDSFNLGHNISRHKGLREDENSCFLSSSFHRHVRLKRKLVILSFCRQHTVYITQFLYRLLHWEREEPLCSCRLGWTRYQRRPCSYIYVHKMYGFTGMHVCTGVYCDQMLYKNLFLIELNTICHPNILPRWEVGRINILNISCQR